MLTQALLSPGGIVLAAAVLLFAFVLLQPRLTRRIKMLPAWTQGQRQRREARARREAADWGYLRAAEWFKWRRIASSYVSGETVPEPERQARR